MPRQPEFWSVEDRLKQPTHEAPPDGGTHWTAWAMAAATGVSRAKALVI